MNNLLNRRRGLMQGGEDAPVFVDWINTDGQAYISIPYLLTDVNVLEITLTALKTGMFFQNRRKLNTQEISIGHNGTSILFRFGKIALDYPFGKSNIINQKRIYSVGSNSAHDSFVATIKDTDGNTVFNRTGGPDTFSLKTSAFGVYQTDTEGGKLTLDNNLFLLHRFRVLETDGTTVTEVMDLLPYYNGREYGLLDVINDVFRGNDSGIGAFTGGYDN